MEIQLLGPVEARADGVLLGLGPAKPRLVLAALTVAPGTVVPLDTLVDRVWGAAPPGRPAATLYPYLSQLRQVLEPAGAAIVRGSGGYRCEVPPDCVDLVRFRAALAAARQADDLTATESLEEALVPWPGLPLAGLGGAWADRLRDALWQERLAGYLMLAELHQRNGALGAQADRLLAVADDHPLSEPLAGHVIRALALADRRAEALSFYARFREHLGSELGEDPGEALQDLHLRLLRRAPEFRGDAAPVAAPNKRLVPRQLPTVTRHFTGRKPELKALDELLAAAADAPGGVLSVVAGTGGVGKTTLAVHWAQRVADRFPDGQLYVNLRGFTADGQPVPAADALRGFLEAMGVPADQVPRDAEARSSTFRSMAAGRRMLVLLDDARDVGQVRPLLPGTPGCLTLVTSRDQLTGLVAEHGAEPLSVGLLPAGEASRLLGHFLGRERVAAEPEAAAQLVDACARLPLALVVAASRAATAPELLLSDMVGELSDQSRRLDGLQTDDRSITVSAVFAASYRALGAPARRLFGLVGLHPGTDISVAATAALTGHPSADAKRLLGELCRVGLLAQHRPGRYACHDLIRLFARDRAIEDEPADSRREAAARMLRYYHDGSVLAMGLYAPGGRNRRPQPLDPDNPAIELDDRGAAIDWLDGELANLIASAVYAAEHGSPEHAADLSVLLFRYLDATGRHEDALVLHTEAGRVADGPMRGRVLACLGTVCWRLGRYDEAVRHLGSALEVHQQFGNTDGEGVTLTNLAIVHIEMGQLSEAIEHLRRAVSLHRSTGNLAAEADSRGNLCDAYIQLGDLPNALAEASEQYRLVRQAGDRSAEGVALSNLGTVLRRLGRLDDALDHHQQALAVVREVGYRDCEVQVLNGLGLTMTDLGRYADGASRHREALVLATELGNRYEQARAHDGLAVCSAALGDVPAAERYWRAALELHTALGTPDAADVARRLSELRAGPGRSAD